ncbi:MAG: hypothetical protein ACR2G3_02095 [Solirubrobacterales bacterium]
MFTLAIDLLLAPGALQTLSDLAPYVALFAAGFLVAAWGQSAKVPLAIAIGITIILGAVLLFQLEANDFSGSNSPF